MKQRWIVSIFLAAAMVYVLAVFLWPSGRGMPEKTARLAGVSQEHFQPERFGVPAPTERQNM